MNEVVERKANPMAEVRLQLSNMEAQFSAALPDHIPVSRFMRVVLTAVQNNARLITHCDRKSLFGAAMKAAQDGLVPDGRDAALVEYRGEVQYLPMVAGIRKKVRNSGELSTWDVAAVYANDFFEFQLGDNPQINHRPNLTDPGELVAVYSIAKMKDGSISRDVMGVRDVTRIRDRSNAWAAFKAGKIKSTPWSTDFDEMAKKTVAKRHSKVLPMSTDLDDLLRADDHLYEAGHDAAAKVETARPRSLSDRLAALEGAPEITEVAGGPVIDAETGEVTQGGDAPNTEQAPAGDQRAPALDAIRDEGREAARKGMARKAVPPKYRDDQDSAAAWVAGFDEVKNAAAAE